MNMLINQRRFYVAASLFFLLILFFILGSLSLLPNADTGDRFTGDAVVAYAGLIEKGIITDWHSDILIAIGIFLRQVVRLLFGVNLRGVFVLYVFYLASTALIIINVLMWNWRLFKCNSAFICCLISFIAAYCCCTRMTFIGLDYFFCAVLFSSLSISIYLREVRNKKKKILLSVALLVFLILAVSFRRNGVLLLPFILLYSYPALSKKLGRVKIGALALVLSCCIYVLPHYALKILVPVIHEYPLAPMMASDMMIASSLGGVSPQNANAVVSKLQYDGEIYSLMTYKPFHKLTLETNISRNKDDEKNLDKEWILVRDNYIAEWGAHPKEMMGAKILQMMYFYTGGYVPKCLRNIFDLVYPEQMQQNIRWRRCGITMGKLYSCMVALVLGLICSGGAAITLLKGFPKEMMLRREILYMVSIGLVYSLSFMLITPTPSIRYVSASMLINSVYFPAFVILFILHKIKGCSF